MDKSKVSDKEWAKLAAVLKKIPGIRMGCEATCRRFVRIRSSYEYMNYFQVVQEFCRTPSWSIFNRRQQLFACFAKGAHFKRCKGVCIALMTGIAFERRLRGPRAPGP
ncbi:MAG: hypothetical protein JWR68_810 [Polaromonas sp.]|nr:hypothetical protein [Polaromonas sp.]